jgi:4'-phosphopantetheinyl transferase
MLNDNEVHLWRASLEMTHSHVKALEKVLSSDELDRAGRFHVRRDREHFVAGRGILRLILGRYLNIAPTELHFRYGLNGKPELAEETAGGFIGFNVSHSQGLALFAVTLGRQVGVDLEYIRGDISVEDLVDQFFSPGEVLAFKALPPDERQRTFFIWWARKEAYLKARGSGLAVDPRGLDLSHITGNSALLPEQSGEKKESARYFMIDVDAGAGYAAALAVEGYLSLYLRFHQFSFPDF